MDGKVGIKNKMKNIGIMGVNPPKDICNDPNCPFHGNIGVRGRVFKGVVESVKSLNTVIVRWERRIYYPKYERFEKRFTKVSAHKPGCIHLAKGDSIVIGECRPISKTKKFVVLSKVDEK